MADVEQDQHGHLWTASIAFVIGMPVAVGLAVTLTALAITARGKR